MNDYLTTAEAAIALDVTVACVQRWISAELLPAERLGKSWAIRCIDVDQFVPPVQGRPRKAPEALPAAKRRRKEK